MCVCVCERERERERDLWGKSGRKKNRIDATIIQHKTKGEKDKLTEEILVAMNNKKICL